MTLATSGNPHMSHMSELIIRDDGGGVEWVEAAAAAAGTLTPIPS